MDRHLKRVLALGLMALGLGWGAGKAEAFANPDSMLLSVTPANVNYGVDVSSVHANGYDFGSLNLAATTESTAAIQVTNSGSVSEFFALKVDNSNGGWQPVASGTPAQDRFKLIALFNSTQPDTASYGSNGTAVSGSYPNPAGNSYGQGGAKTTPLSSQNLWLQLTMPDDVTTGSNAQTVRLYVNAQGT